MEEMVIDECMMSEMMNEEFLLSRRVIREDGNTRASVGVVERRSFEERIH